MDYLNTIGQKAKAAAHELALLSAGERDRALLAMANALESTTEEILTANAKDLRAARESDMSPAMQDRLTLTDARIAGIAAALRECAALPDPLGRTLEGITRSNGLVIAKVSVPLGVVGIIFESRPNVAVDCAGLCIKSGNACILRGGKEAIHSNTALVAAMRASLASEGLDPNFIQLIEDTSRETATAMMKLNKYIDVLIPRGGAGLISAVVENATVPVIETGIGICHAYVDDTADLEVAASIVHNGKTSRPSVCNALECLLVHQSVAATFLPIIRERLSSHDVQLRGCEKTCGILGAGAVPATPEDYETEFLDYILAVRVVKDIGAAVEHIRVHSSGHSEVIVTQSLESANRFTREVDSAAVYVNASTRYTDGGEFGLGAEIGISTQKLHARGPMGLRELVSYKYVITGSGQVR
ncbi:MAG: glutamate-5-semialdehyde dehydrogenase [Oscillospiraceae bacterium]|nr:glutamate-5-semialdehyde dehydrogenase [Oscillospiraceae bacterium]